MCDNALVAQIVGVSMAFPVAWADVDLDVAADASAITQDEYGIEKVGSGLKVPAPRRDHQELFSGAGCECLGAEGVIRPDALQVPFGVVERAAPFADQGAMVDLGIVGVWCVVCAGSGMVPILHGIPLPVASNPPQLCMVA